MKFKDKIKKQIKKFKLPAIIVLMIIGVFYITSGIADIEKSVADNNECLTRQSCLCKNTCENIGAVGWDNWIFQNNGWGNDECFCIKPDGTSEQVM